MSLRRHGSAATEPWMVTINGVEATAGRLGKRTNWIKTNKYNPLTFLPVNLWEQFHRLANIFFLAIAVIALIPATQALSPETAAAPLLSVLAATMIRDALEDRRRKRSDREINSKKAHTLLTERFGDDTSWESIKPGMVVKIQNDELVPADCLILSTSESSGLCYIETVNLDGESNLKVREAHSVTHGACGSAEALGKLDGEVTTVQPDNNLFKFDGNLTARSLTGAKQHPFQLSNVLLRGTQLRNTEWVHAVVVYTGHDTKVMRNITKPRLKRTVIDGLLNRHILGVFLLMFVICTAFAIVASQFVRNELEDVWYIDNFDGATTAGIISFFAYLLLLHSLVPLSAYVSSELVKLGHAYFVSHDLELYDPETDSPATARTSALSEELGMVRYLLSDKTGTLTQNQMQFASASIGGEVYGRGSEDGRTNPDTATNPDTNPDTTTNGRTEAFDECPHSQPMPGFADQRLLRDLRARRDEFSWAHFMLNLALNNEVLPQRDREGDPQKLGADKFNSQSPDETALAEAARDLGWSFYNRDNDRKLYLNVLGEERVYQHLETIEFSSVRKRMTVIVRRLDKDEGGQVVVLTKGADEVMFGLLADPDSPTRHATDDHLLRFANAGLRTLVMACKLVSGEAFAAWEAQWHDAAVSQVLGTPVDMAELAAEMESGLTLLGATAVEDLLQENAPQTIARLRRANIAVWVLTGDKRETAVSIGKTINLLTPDLRHLGLSHGAGEGETIEAQLKARLDEVGLPSPLTAEGEVDKRVDLKASTPNTPFAIVVDGITLREIFKHAASKELFAALAAPSAGVICCRCAPLQKAQVVGLVRRRFKAVTLAIGDGANDVSMIKEADIGVGISGKEGRQAVLASDYAIAKFRFLERLLLFHGRQSYERVSWLLLYFFYKNYTYILVNFWFGWFCAGSSQTIYDQRYIMLYNVIFTSVPGLVFGLVDQDVSDEASLANPELYRESQRNASFGDRSYWLWVIDAFYQSLVCFGVGLGAAAQDVSSRGSGAHPWDLWEAGTIMFTSVVLLVNVKLLVDAHNWTRPFVVTVVVSVVAYFAFLLIYQAILPEFVPSYFAFYHLAAGGTFWFAVLISIALALFPSFLVKYAQLRWFPSPAQIIAEQEHLKVGHRRVRRRSTMQRLAAERRIVKGPPTNDTDLDTGAARRPSSGSALAADSETPVMVTSFGAFTEHEL